MIKLYKLIADVKIIDDKRRILVIFATQYRTMKILENFSLKNNNTFKVDVKASLFIEFYDNQDFLNYLKSDNSILNIPYLIIGEGSNLLFTEDFDGAIIHPSCKKIEILNHDENYVYVEASAGVIWDDFVDWTLSNNAFGLENLSLIPGTVGASAVQNIGAYGVEAGDFIYSVKCLNLNEMSEFEIMNSDCKFAYRNSIFKNELKSGTLVMSVIYRLNRLAKIKTDYADINNYFKSNDNLSPFDIRRAVIEIRNSKLPDPEIIGNAGSFFKNPIIDKTKFDELVEKFSDLRYYEMPNQMYKIAAGWMIDKCGLKGFSIVDAAVHEKQALVIINKTGKATGKDILELANFVKEKVYNVFQVYLEPEVIIL